MGDRNDLKQVFLEEVVTVLGDGLHGTPVYDNDGDYYFINGNNLVGRIVINDKTKKVNQHEYEKYKKDLNDRTILVSINGTLGKVASYNGENIVLGKSACYFNVKPEYCKKYIQYVMLSDLFKNYLTTHATGTTIKNIGLKQMRAFQFPIPPYKEQKAIAKILTDLDEKIEVHNQINKKLEEMAQAIFKHWFVDFEFPNEEGKPYKSSGGEMDESELGMIPKGWQVKRFKSIVDLAKDNIKPGNHLKGLRYNPIDTLPMKKITIEDYKEYIETKSSLIMFKKYDVLVGAMRVYFHRVVLAPYDGITRTTTFVLRSKNLIDIPYNLFALNQEDVIEYATNTSKGSTMPYAIWDNGLGDFKIAYPQKTCIREFHRVVMPIIDIMLNYSKQNQEIKSIRDTLLPKLMSGEIRVPYNGNGEEGHDQ